MASDTETEFESPGEEKVVHVGLSHEASLSLFQSLKTSTDAEISLREVPWSHQFLKIHLKLFFSLLV